MLTFINYEMSLEEAASATRQPQRRSEPTTEQPWLGPTATPVLMVTDAPAHSGTDPFVSAAPAAPSSGEESNWRGGKRGGHCKMCNGERHRFIDCKAFADMPADRRRNLIRTEGRCVRCLGAHLRDNKPCPRPDLRCKGCQGAHSRWLCAAPSAKQPRSMAPGGPPPPPRGLPSGTTPSWVPGNASTPTTFYSSATWAARCCAARHAGARACCASSSRPASPRPASPRRHVGRAPDMIPDRNRVR